MSIGNRLPSNDTATGGNNTSAPSGSGESHQRNVIILSLEAQREQAQGQYNMYVMNGMSVTQAAWKIFDNFNRMNYTQVAAEYLDKHIDDSKGVVRKFEQFCYDLFLDFSKGRKGIKNDDYAEIAAGYIVGTRDVNKLLELKDFFEKKNDTRKADALYVTLYKVYLEGDGVRKDLNKAKEYIKKAIEIENDPYRRACLREIYEQQYNGDTNKSYECVIADGIAGAKSDYADYRKSKGESLEAMKLYVEEKNFSEAYNAVNIRSANELDEAIRKFTDGGGANTSYAESLKLMRSKFAMLQNIFTVKEEPLMHSLMASAYMLGPIWTIYRTVKKLGVIYLLIGLLGTVGFTLIGAFTLGNAIGAIFGMSALLIWMFAMIGYDVNLRNNFRETCRLYDRLTSHRQLEDDDISARFKDKSKKFGEPWSWALILPVLFWTGIAVFIGIGLTRPDIDVDKIKQQSEDSIKHLGLPNASAVDEHEEAFKVLSNFHDLISKKDFPQAYACLDEEFRSTVTYDDWLKGVKDSPKISALNMKVMSETEDGLLVEFTHRIEVENNKSEDYEAVALMRKEVGDWKIDGFALKDSLQSEQDAQPDAAKSEPSKVEEKKVETPKVEEKKSETPKVEEKKVEIPEKPLDDKAQALAVLNDFHDSITKKDYRKAYACFSEAFQNRVPYDGWAAGFKTTVSSSALDAKITDASADSITIHYTLRAVDDPGGTRNFNSNVVMVKTADGWKINATSNKLK